MFSDVTENIFFITYVHFPSRGRKTPRPQDGTSRCFPKMSGYVSVRRKTYPDILGKHSAKLLHEDDEKMSKKDFPSRRNVLTTSHLLQKCDEVKVIHKKLYYTLCKFRPPGNVQIIFLHVTSLPCAGCSRGRAFGSCLPLSFRQRATA